MNLPPRIDPELLPALHEMLHGSLAREGSGPHALLKWLRAALAAAETSLRTSNKTNEVYRAQGAVTSLLSIIETLESTQEAIQSAADFERQSPTHTGETP